MTAISTAVDINRVSAVVGYEIKRKPVGNSLGFAPQSIAILAEAQTTFQSTMPTFLDFTTAKEVGQAFGFSSPAYLAARVLRPPQGGNSLGSVRTILYSIDEASGAAATVITKSITGTATGNATHTL
jgi:hypothetical protein